MATYVLVTEQHTDIRTAMNELEGTELIGGIPDVSWVWNWEDPTPTDLEVVQALPGYIGSIQVE